MNQVQERKISQELNLLKTKIGLNIATSLRKTVKEYLEQEGEEILNPTPQRAKQIVEKILGKFVEQTNKIIFNQKIKEKLEKNQEITLEDIEWQLNQVKIFELWLRQQIEGYLVLKSRYLRQQKQTYQTKSEEYKKMVGINQKQLDFIRQEQKEIVQEVENRKKENKKIVMRIMKNLETERKDRQKQLVKDYEEWANDPEEQEEIRAWKRTETEGWDD